MADKCIVFLNEQQQQQQQQQAKQGHEERNQLQSAEESKVAIEAKNATHTPTSNNNHHLHHHHQTSTSLNALPNDNDTAAYLETPVLDDMEQNSTSSASDGLLPHHRHHHSQSKPKRLSDEFGSGDEESNELLFDQDAACDGVSTSQNASSAHIESECNENLIENNELMSPIVDQNRNASELPNEHSSSSLGDDVNGDDEPNANTMLASCLLSENSLIINRTNGDEQRLNLNLLGNTFSQRVEKIMAAAQELDASDTLDNNCKDTTDGVDGVSSNATESANKNLSSTPTSSRRAKRSRLYGPNEASSSKGLNLSKRSDGAASSSSDVVLSKHLDYSDLMPKHKRLPFYPNYSNDSSSSDNISYANDDASSNNQLEAGSSSLRDEPQADANLCPSCTNDAKEDELAVGEYDDDIDEDIDEEIDEETAQDLAKPSTSKSAATNDSSLVANSADSASNRPKWNRECDCNDVDLLGGHASGASTSYRRRTTSATGTSHSTAHANNDDANGMMNLDAESNTCADWPCESNSDCEEVCTCRDDTDDDIIFR